MNCILAAVAAAAVAGIAGFAAAARSRPVVDERLFEMRTYVANPGKMKDLHARFREHTCKLFEKQGIVNVGYWSPTSGENAENTLVYIISYPNKDAQQKMWKAFLDDPEWKAAKTASEKDGSLVASVKSVFMTATDYSAIK
ncbi:MAG TPA: NIPSNAP family protein [Planctomycetota bacterium]|nr:NIPSNAP family protein [Planctomycetota bacterium]